MYTTETDSKRKIKITHLNLKQEVITCLGLFVPCCYDLGTLYADVYSKIVIHLLGHLNHYFLSKGNPYTEYIC